MSPDKILFTCVLCSALLGARCRNAAQPSDLRSFQTQLNDRYAGDYFNNFPLQQPDSCLLRIKQDIPPRFQANLCETLYYHLGDDISPQTALQHLNAYDRSFPSDSLKAFTNMMRGVLHMNAGRFDSAELYLNRSYEAHLKAGRSVRAGDALKYLAQTQLYQANYPDAIRLLLDTYELFRPLPDSSESDRKCGVAIDLSVAYSRSNDPKKALYWAQHLWKMVDTPRPWANKFKIQAADVLTGAYIKLEMADSTLYYAHRCLALRQTLQVEYRRFLTLMYIAKGNFLKNNCAAALDTLYLSQSLAPSREQALLQTYHLGFGDCFLCLGKLDSARLHFEQVMHSADTGYQARAYEGLSKVYEKQGNYAQALQANREGNRLNNLVFNNEKSKSIGYLENRFEVQARENQLEALKKQHKITQQGNLITALSLLLGFFAALALAFHQRNRRKLLEQEKVLAQARELLQQQALEHTEAQLLAHKEELAQTAHLLEIKEALISDLQMKLSAPTPVPHDSGAFPRMKILTPEDWLKFQQVFDRQIPGFSRRLKQQFPDLTNAETRLFMLIKLNFDSREIADILGISVESIWRNRNRLRRKLSLDESVDLDRFINYF